MTTGRMIRARRHRGYRVRVVTGNAEVGMA
ncbi:acetolactate synthase regulatory subunit [Actinoplanes couchii]|nr:acetolactate synthase regulatory subunit [Actinoplanes couchii]